MYYILYIIRVQRFVQKDFNFALPYVIHKVPEIIPLMVSTFRI